ncbi:MAG TPA: hypothetical protein PLS59_08220 [Kiritimatiellia bacterium]|nr:hypothetical protein [Kiritimatiellia bacterium]
MQPQVHGVAFHGHEFDIAAVALDQRPDFLNKLFHFFLHGRLLFPVGGNLLHVARLGKWHRETRPHRPSTE